MRSYKYLSCFFVAVPSILLSLNSFAANKVSCFSKSKNKVVYQKENVLGYYVTYTDPNLGPKYAYDIFRHNLQLDAHPGKSVLDGFTFLVSQYEKDYEKIDSLYKKEKNVKCVVYYDTINVIIGTVRPENQSPFGSDVIDTYQEFVYTPDMILSVINVARQEKFKSIK